MSFRHRYNRDQIPYFHAWYQRNTAIKCVQKRIITPETKIATIGSCFASEIAKSMKRLGLRGGMNPSGLVYNTRSIVQELQRAFEDWSGHLIEPYWKIKKGFISPFNHPKKVFDSIEALKNWNNDLDERASNLFLNADVIVITLGLIKAWMQPKNGICYRYLPHEDVYEDVAPRFHRLTVAEMLKDLNEIKSSINQYTNASIILTVSPIPLHATFTSLDIRVANAESKSRIRAAVSEFIEANPDVYYFHSYEIVTTSEKNSDFMLEDGRHVSQRGIDYILVEFIRQFATEYVKIPHIDTSWLTPPIKTATQPKRSLINKLRKGTKHIVKNILSMF